MHLAGCMGGGGGMCARFCSLLEAITSIFAACSPGGADEPAQPLCINMEPMHTSCANTASSAARCAFRHAGSLGKTWAVPRRKVLTCYGIMNLHDVSDRTISRRLDEGTHPHSAHTC